MQSRVVNPEVIQFAKLGTAVKTLAKDTQISKLCAVDTNHKGVKSFVLIKEWQSILAEWFASNDRHMYEVILPDATTRLFMEIDIPTASTHHSSIATTPSELVRDIIALVLRFTNDCSLFNRVIVFHYNQHSARYRLVWPDVEFDSIECDLKQFVICFRQWMFTNYHKTDFTYIMHTKRQPIRRAIIDCSIYHRNKFLLGYNQSTSHGTQLRLTSELSTINSIDPIDCLIQPLKGNTLDTAEQSEWMNRITARCQLQARLDTLFSQHRYWLELPLECEHNVNSAYWTIDCNGSRGKRLRFHPTQHPVDHDVAIYTDKDMLRYISAYELRVADFTGLFLPVLSNLALTIDTDSLLQWICADHGIPHQYESVITTLRKARRVYLSPGDLPFKLCQEAIVKSQLFTENRSPRVLDRRTDRPILTIKDMSVIIPHPTTHTPIDTSTDQFQNILHSILRKDGKSGQERVRRCFFITGKMGSSKTGAIRIVSERLLRTDQANHALYICPRVVLCDQMADEMITIHSRELLLPQNARTSKRSINFVRLHNRADKSQDSRVDDILNNHVRLQRKLNTNKSPAQFTTCVINSIQRAPLINDIIIIDEPVVSTYTLSDKNIYSALKDRIHRARIILIVDAAFTPLIHRLFTDLFTAGFRPLSSQELSKYTPVGSTKRAFAKKVCHGRKAGYTYMNDPTAQECLYKQAPIRMFAMYSSIQAVPIFTRLVEHETRSGIINSMLEDVYGTAHNSPAKVVVYTTTKREAKFVHNALCLYPSIVKTSSLQPTIAFITAETLADLSRQAVAQRIHNSDVLITTPAIGIGSSWTVPNMFDAAYALIDYSKGAAGVDEIVQMTARVRSITRKTLHYNVRTTSNRCSRIVLADIPHDLTDVDKFFTYNNVINTTIISDLPYAKIVTRNAMITGFAHTTTETLHYTNPHHEYRYLQQHEQRIVDRKYKRLQRIIRRHTTNVVSHLPDEAVYISNTKPTRVQKSSMSTMMAIPIVQTTAQLHMYAVRKPDHVFIDLHRRKRRYDYAFP